MSGPLEGTRVVDFTQGWAGPFCSMELGDLGAMVIKIEPPEGDFTRNLGPPMLSGEAIPFLAVNRSKRSISLDIEKAPGLGIARRLIQRADVVLESFDPGVADTLGIGYEAMKIENPQLIYGSITPFGISGPYRDWAGSELVLQALSGVFASQPGGDRYIAFGGETVSLFSGKYLLHGILAALVYRSRAGSGQRIDLAMMDAALARTWSEWPGRDTTKAEEAPLAQDVIAKPMWAGHDRSISVGSGRVEFNFRVNGYTPNDKAWMAFFEEVGAPELVGDPRFETESSTP